ncbi:V4R domain-containing protein [Candidatus Aenigmatarchaeota archaeon]
MGLGMVFKKFLMARQVEMEKGRFAVSGVRLTGSAVSTLVSIQEEIIQEMGSKGVKILYAGGKIGGNELVKKLMRMMGVSGMKTVDLLATGCTEMLGWGIVSVLKCDFDKNHAVFNVEDSPLGIKRQSKAFCHIERGLIAGAMEEIFGKKIDAIEVKCRSLGHPFCQFDIKPTKEFDPKDPLVKEQLPVDGVSNTKNSKKTSKK